MTAGAQLTARARWPNNPTRHGAQNPGRTPSAVPGAALRLAGRMPAIKEQKSTMDEDWKQAWQPVVDVIGQNFGSLMTGADEVSAAAIRRYLEPLEFDCALHCDAAVAREHGFDDIVAPNTVLCNRF